MIYAHKLPIAIVTLLLAACVTSLAQEHPLPPRHRPPPKERPQGHEGRGDRHQAHDHRGHHDKNRPLDTFMEKIRATDPEEFTRLDTLRTENPKQFHQQLRKRRNHLIGKQFLAKLEEMPRLGEAIHKLTREEKKQVAHGISEFFKHNKIDGVFITRIFIKLNLLMGIVFLITAANVDIYMGIMVSWNLI